MTWAEFQIRIAAYKRKRANDEALTREIAWAALNGFNVDPRLLKKGKQKFWPIPLVDNKPINNSLKEAIKAKQKLARENYLKEVQKKNGKS